MLCLFSIVHVGMYDVVDVCSVYLFVIRTCALCLKFYNYPQKWISLNFSPVKGWQLCDCLLWAGCDTVFYLLVDVTICSGQVVTLHSICWWCDHQLWAGCVTLCSICWWRDPLLWTCCDTLLYLLVMWPSSVGRLWPSGPVTALRQGAAGQHDPPGHDLPGAGPGTQGRGAHLQGPDPEGALGLPAELPPGCLLDASPAEHRGEVSEGVRRQCAGWFASALLGSLQFFNFVPTDSHHVWLSLAGGECILITVSSLVWIAEFLFAWI